jgi:hypothetical protein
MGHDHEVCWLLWIIILLAIKLDDQTAAQLISYPNAVVALMGMHARTRGLFKKSLSIANWEMRVSAASLDEDWRLFAYECAAKDWIKQKIDWTKIKCSIFERMHEAKVTFYRSSEKNADVANLEKGKPAIPSTGFGYDGDEEEYIFDVDNQL